MEDKGQLVFHFTINPIQFKATLLRMQKELEAEATQSPASPEKKPAEAAPKSVETLEAGFLLKSPISNNGLTKLLEMLIKCYSEEDDANKEELIKNLAKEHVVWTSQAIEILYLFKHREMFEIVAPYLLNRIIDRHARFAIFSHFEDKRIATNVCRKMGQSFFFSFWNPTGHYELNLANFLQRDVAMSLIALNKEIMNKITEGLEIDRSQRGNKSCMRNEKHNGQVFIWSVGKQTTFFRSFINRLGVA